MKNTHHFSPTYSKYEVIISFFVEEYFSTHEDISPQDLDLLEKEIRNAIRLKIDAAEQERKANLQSQSNKESKNDVEAPPVVIFRYY